MLEQRFHWCEELCKSNLSHYHTIQDTTGDVETRKILLRRANELVNVLKVPSIASAVLSPPPHSGGGAEMKKQTNLAYLLQSTANYLQT